MRLFFLIVFIIGINLSTFYPTFNLALFGDDWLTFWRYFANLGPNSSGQWNHISYFFTSYGPQDILMGSLQKIYGYESIYYYLTSYILRILAALSLIPLIYYLTKNKSAVFISVGLFLITPTGIETTNWVFNMPSYIAIIFLNLFFYYFLISRFHPNKLILAGIFFFLALISQPIRMHGLLPTVFILELFWIIQNRNKLIFQKAAFRILIFILISIPTILWLEKSPVATVGNLFTYNSFKPEYLLNPFITLGAVIFPSDIIMFGFPAGLYILLFLIGALFFIVSILLLKRFRHNYLVSTGIFLGISWSILSFIFAWWREPHAVFFTTHRYLIVSAAGIIIFLSVLISLFRNSKSKPAFWPLMFAVAVIYFYSARDYIIQSGNAHNQTLSKKIWNSIPYFPEAGKSDEPLIFYFVGDGTNEAILHDVITFGFPPHIGLIYNIFDEKKLPVATGNAEDVIKATRIEKVYAFQLQGDNLVDVTEIIRNKLKEIKK